VTTCESWDVGVASRYPERSDTTAAPNAAVLNGFRAALREAQLYVGATAPNPPVGCAILDADGEILAVAAHQCAGSAHAEAAALALCAERGVLDRAVTAVVTLEPCNHVGRTPPCTHALLGSPIRSVWIGCADPNGHVPGGGAAYLAAEGMQVAWLEQLSPDMTEPLLTLCQALIVPFTHHMQTGLAWITVKQALTMQGEMIPPVGHTVFTSEKALTHAHRIRRATDAIVTGVGTVLADNPGFDVRRVPDHAGRAARPLVVCARRGGIPEDWMRRAETRGFTPCVCGDVADVAQMLGEQGVLWAMVEAGPALLQTIRAQALWDEWLTIRQMPDGTEQVTRVVRVPGVAALSVLDEIEGAA